MERPQKLAHGADFRGIVMEMGSLRVLISRKVHKDFAIGNINLLTPKRKGAKIVNFSDLIRTIIRRWY